MATERQSPDALLDQTNLSGAVSAIQDDPDSPNANWLTAASNNADSICRTSFPTPTGNPTIGADLQQFKIWVRKMGGTGTPKVRIELYENGALLATLLADTDVTSTSGVLLSGTWNANLLGTADGSLVECRIYGTKSGGAPAARAAIEVGAAEWNVVYSVGGTTHLGAATLAGVGALATIGQHILYGLAGLSGIGTVAAIGQRIVTGIAALVGTGAVACIGTVGGLIQYGAATLSGLGTVVAKAVATFAGKATVAGVGSVVAIGRGIFVGTATLSGVGTVAAVGARIFTGIAALTGSGLVAVKGAGVFIGKATLAGIGSVVASGLAITTHYGSAILSGVGSMVITGLATRLGRATLSGLATMTAVGKMKLVAPTGKLVVAYDKVSGDIWA